VLYFNGKNTSQPLPFRSTSMSCDQVRHSRIESTECFEFVKYRMLFAVLKRNNRPHFRLRLFHSSDVQQDVTGHYGGNKSCDEVQTILYNKPKVVSFKNSITPKRVSLAKVWCLTGFVFFKDTVNVEPKPTV